ncbi:MAG TPA: formate dehydrogenase accessory sulfurtransferase FdhD [Dokdonella sp.]|nr:formate dehydrogenase accessory sulfurtransferase FdhD [Dokdonella sp.]
MSARDEAHSGWVRRPLTRSRAGAFERTDDCVAEEVPVALVYNGRPHVVMMATPCDLDDFALGFSLSEAVIGDASELDVVATRTLLEGIELELRVPAARADALEQRKRNLTGRSGCGLCGAQALEDALRQPPPVADGPRIDARALERALAGLQARQPLAAATGATHAAGWAGTDGEIALVREDVGRHNALDKLLGALVRGGLDARAGFVVVTSRASYEMVQKAATLGVGLLAAISAPTALAIQLAMQARVTLVGFARGDQCVVYAHAGRIDGAEGPFR